VSAFYLGRKHVCHDVDADVFFAFTLTRIAFVSGKSFFDEFVYAEFDLFGNFGRGVDVLPLVFEILEERRIGVGCVLGGFILSIGESHLAPEPFDVFFDDGEGLLAKVKMCGESAVGIEGLGSRSSFSGSDLDEETGGDELGNVFTDGCGCFADFVCDFSD